MHRQPVRRLLLIKTSSLGDVVHNLPVVSDISAHCPDCTIDWVVEEAFAEVPALHPRVRTVIPVAMRRWRRALYRPAVWREIANARRGVRAERYDAAIDTQGLVKSGLLAAWVRGPVHGQDRASAREPLAARFYDHVYTIATGRHAVTRNRDLAAQVLGYALPQTPPDYGIAAPVDAGVPLPSQPYIVWLHGTSRDSKLWPEDRWIALGEALAANGPVLLLPWGSPAEHARAQRLAARLPAAQVLPRLGLRALTAVLGGARGVVGVDSGLTHLAVALDRPTVALYTDTSPQLTGVLPADPARAVNLGAAGVVPPVADVLAALQQLRVL